MPSFSDITRQRELQQELIAKRREIFRLSGDISDIVRQLRENGCDHSETEDYAWEWDSGYGRQHDRTGKRCVYCGFIDLWCRNHFVDPKDIE